MSQFPQDLDAEFQPTGERQISGLAIGSIICSLICCIPGLPAIGALLGIVSAVTISSNPQRKGMGLAIAAIVLGVCITAMQAWLGYQTYEFSKRFIEAMEESPRNIFEPVNSRDMDAFRDAFHGPASNASDDEVQAFFDAVHDRYGAFQQARPDDSQAQDQPGMGAQSFTIPYVAEFEHETVDLEIKIIIADDTGSFVVKPGSLIIIDPDHDNLEFPPGGGPADASPSPQSPQPPADPDGANGEGDGTS